MINGGASWRDALKGFMTDIAQSFSKMASDMAARAIMTNIMGSFGGFNFGGGQIGADVNPAMANVAHGGGIIGYDDFPTRSVPSDVFADAPRLHLGTDEYPAILQRGEQVIPKDQVGNGGGLKSSAPSIIVNNYTGQQFEATQPQFDGEKWVLSIIAKNVRQDGKFRKMLRG